MILKKLYYVYYICRDLGREKGGGELKITL